MNKTTLILLFIVGILGVLAQAFKKMNEMNKRMGGKFSFKEYLGLERFILAGSFIGVLLLTIAAYMVPELAQAGKLLIFGQFCMGWFGLSILEFFGGQAKKKVGQFLGASDTEIDDIKNT